jgi:hypothetical protein
MRVVRDARSSRRATPAPASRSQHAELLARVEPPHPNPAADLTGTDAEHYQSRQSAFVVLNQNAATRSDHA